jgi:excinuclease ABC subunit B
MTKPALEKAIAKTKKAMQEAAKKLEFLEAAQLRDEIRLTAKKRSIGDFCG